MVLRTTEEREAWKGVSRGSEEVRKGESSRSGTPRRRVVSRDDKILEPRCLSVCRLVGWVYGKRLVGATAQHRQICC